MSFRTRAHPASPGFARCWDVTAEGNTVVVGQGGHQVYGVPTSKPWRAVHLLLRTQRIALQVSACCLVESNQLRMNSTMVFDVSLLPEFFEPHPTADSSTADDVGAATQLLMQRIPHQLVADDLVVDSGSRDVDVVNDSGSPACPLSWGARDHDREHDRAPAGPCDARVEEPVGSAADRSKPEERLRDEIFDMVLPTKWTAELSAPAGLTCTLFRYQRRALAWMSWQGWLPSQALRHPLWEPVQFQTGLRIIYNAWTGEARRKLRDVPPAPAISGGILSDMMGLGKTVEVIAHILQCPAPYTRPSLHQPTASHGPAPQQGPLLRLSQANGGSSGQALAAAGPVHPGGTRCSLAAAPVPILALSAVSAEASLAAAPVAAVQVTAGTHEASIRHTATLIVCPVSILQQWQREFARHAPGVNVKVYEGLRWYQKEEEAKNKKAKKKKQVEVAPPLEYTYDMQEDARKAVAQLLEADVVLTTYWVLQQEVDFNPAVERLQSLRKPKKYQVPLSPLLHLRWWRLVLDEAQMVGSGLTAVAAMASRVVSHHRWAVTGTPVGPYGLHDVGNLLAVLGHDPFADARKWKECIIKPYEGGEPGASARLAAVLKPLMWRNSHAWVAADHPLPPRTLRIARLHFTPGERAFYNHIVSKTREARQAMEEKEAHPNEPAPPSPTAGASRKRKRRGGAAADEATLLREATERAVAQLRLACIHPQLTQYWKTLSGELQLEQGGALSMAEIMQRMCDGVQSELQSAERELCGTLNTLAQRLLAAKAPASRQRRKSAGPHKVHGQGEEEDLADEKGKAAVVDVEMLDGDADAGAYEEPGDEPGSPVSGAPAAKRAKLGVAGAPDSPVSPHRKKRRSASEYASSLEAHQARLQHAVEVLEQSLRVGEKGIEAMASKEALKKLNDISSANASIRAWRLIEASTAYHLAAAYSQTGREADAEAMRARLADKLADVRSSADEKLVKARSQVEQVADRVAGLKKRLGEEWAAAVSAGWPAEVEGDPRAWLDQLLADYQAAQAQEKQRRNTLEAGDGSTVQVLMGKEVQVALRAREEAALETRMGLEGVVGLPLLQDLVQRLQMAADCLAGRQSDLPARFASLERAQELPAFIPEHWLCWTAMSDASPETTVRIAVAMHQSCGALEVQRVERQVQRFLRAVEKYSKDKHTALLNEELALFAVAQVEEDVMHAAKGEATSATAGPSGHKSIPELERLAASQKERCEKIAARRRFLQNNLFRQPQDKPKCMLCRRALTKANVFRVVSAHTAQTAVDEPKYLQIKVHGSYMSKIDALVRRLVHLRETRPDEKSLVFSQFPLALQLVAKALAVNNIGFSQLGTGRSNENRTALSTFIDGVKKEDPRKEDDKKGQREVHVFLLSLKAGAAGLTLVRANHVFLLEPAVDPAIAQQAIGRVHRIGQTRPVVVTRLLMDDTVEEHVMQAQERRQPLFLDSEPAEEPTSVDAPAPRGDTMAVAEMRGLLDAVLQ
ncbi:hypothetical protein WJX72_011536 [[Myrmecia] bisecta]|uniref:Helicase C-terminal domain-containing protein n=1 Tax=[Myrmecia] bisecta TaxID=41462 RepID=A0AAW1R9C0_9CHLO